MEPTINELFQKYVSATGPVLEEDRYFQYLYESIAAATEKTIEQKSQTLHKVVDEEWLTTVEDSLDALNTIIEKPRRFIVRSEEIVPVALAKKITADSVRHLSQNTQFIEADDNGEVHPSKILNVTNEDSYDLYENRFIYHLIQRLVTFIDKRTDVIFWSTGDETRNVMQFKTRIDDAYEQIEYNLEMKVTNRQSVAENDADNMSVFMRIDRVRRLVSALRHSSFCEIMAGCSKVRSPIQRTNLMMKDPDYRKCYGLWQFLERYDSVGYSIVEQDKAYEIDEEYLIQLYSQTIASYALFKTLTGEDKRDVLRTIDEKRKLHTPKFIKEIREEFVENRDIPDVEIRRVFVEEVTEAQLKAEAELEEERKKTKALTEQMGEYEKKAESARIREERAKAAQAEAEEAKRSAEEEREKALEEKKQAETDASLRIAEAESHAAREVAAAHELRKEAELERDDAKGAAFAAEQRAAEAVEAMKAAVLKSEEATENANRKEAEAEERASLAEARAEEEIALAASRAEERIAEAEARAETEIERAKAEAASRIEETERAASEKTNEIERAASERIERAEAEAASREEAAEALWSEAERKANDAEERIQIAETRVSEAERAKESAMMERSAALTKAEEDRKMREEAVSEKNAAEAHAAETIRKTEDAASMRVSEAEKAKEEALRKAEALSKNAKALEAEALRKAEEAEKLHKEAEDALLRSETELSTAKKMAEDATRLSEDAKKAVREALSAERTAKRAEEKALSRLERETKARLRAEERAKEGTLSKAIATRLFGGKKASSAEPEQDDEKHTQ